MTQKPVPNWPLLVGRRASREPAADADAQIMGDDEAAEAMIAAFD